MGRDRIRPFARRAAAALAAVLALAAAPAAACPGAGDCAVAGGSYRLHLPADAARPVPALLYLHGWGASAGGVMAGREAMRAELAARGYALIAPQGIPRAGRTQNDWAVRDGRPHPRDDLAFLGAVLDDAARRGVDRGRVLMAGFSRGGSMVWDAACARPGLARAYAPVAGAFWEPLPRAEGCAGAVDLFHTHGWADTVVPLEGRPIGQTLVQGDVFESLALLRATLGCTARQPDSRSAGEDGRWRRSWQDCAAGRLDLLLHPGAHVVPAGWTPAALDWFEARLAERP